MISMSNEEDKKSQSKLSGERANTVNDKEEKDNDAKN